jgi:hypothetical protein
LTDVPIYVVDPTRFHAEGALVSWQAAAQRLGIGIGQPIALPLVIELRWMLQPGMGMSTEPFAVWTRPHSTSVPQPLSITQRQLFFLGFLDMITWTEGSMTTVSVDVQAPAGGLISAYSGGPILANLAASVMLAVGNSTVELSAQVIDGLLVSNGVTVTAVRGIGPSSLANLPGWTLLELVGLPVTLAQWGGIGKHGEPQGLVGSFSDAPTAAEARLSRGAPPIGWGPTIAAGVSAPAWTAPNFASLVSEVNSDLLDQLRNIVKSFPPDQQAAQMLTVVLPPPKSSTGQQMSGSGSTSQLSPLTMTFMAAATDPFLNLVLGFGTAYSLSASDTAGNIAGRGAFDFMVTSHWEKGFDGQSAAQDYAAVIPAPAVAPAPPPPANMFTEILGALRPLATDGNWRASVRASWDRPPDIQLFRNASFAAARAGVVPAQPAVALLENRPSGGYRPIAINRAADPPDPEFWRLHVVDSELAIPSNPGTIQVKYGAAEQDIYGQWTPWVAVDQVLAQPDLEPVPIVGATLTPVAPANGSVCPTTLEIEFVWDWRIRSPDQITFVGRMYAAATHGAPPPSVILPPGLDRSLAGGGSALVVTFSGDTPSAPGATIQPLTASGDNFAPGFGSAQGTDTRRFRLTLSGLALDFGSTPFIGLALWAQGQEHIAPRRLSPWSSKPLVISTGDPRPPVVPIEHVKLGSVPDATGSSHVRISWTPQPGAVGYFIYEATEAKILDSHGLPDPAPSDTLDQRLKVVKSAFRSNPIRRDFTRLNATLLQGSSTDNTLPRGSTEIHLYVVLGVSAGEVEGQWPSGPTPDDSLIAIAAPHITAPAAPMIEVQRILDQSATPPVYKSSILITTRMGPRPIQVDLHRVRVDDAAKELDTMGPPVARLTASGGGWTVTHTNDPVYGPYITAVAGTDAPSGSWKRVWYRATAWTGEDDTRGGLPGRSPASNAAWVVLPPADGPLITPLLIGGGTGPADVVLQWTCGAPIARTPLGPHQIAVRANLVGAPAKTTPLLALDSTLDQLGSSEPATGSGVWIVSTTAGITTYRALLRRAAITDSLKFVVRITDPIGRSGTQVSIIPSGPAIPPPDLENLNLRRIAIPFPFSAVLSFTSSSPLVPLLNGPYVLYIELIPPHPVIFPPPPSITIPLGKVPTSGGNPPLPVIRSGPGPVFRYELATAAQVGSFVVRITAPNGIFVQKTVS